jgi:putative oligomerization/nucleic acid binding protein
MRLAGPCQAAGEVRSASLCCPVDSHLPRGLKMLGFHPLLERELRKKGRRALAKVVEAHRGRFGEATGNLPAEQIATTKIHWTLVLSVEPEGEPPFEAKLDDLLGLGYNPLPGDRLPVLYDPDDHSKVLVDQSDEGVTNLANQDITDRTEATIAKMRAQGLGDIADRYQAVADAGLLTNWSSDPAKLRDQIHERQAEIKELMGGQNVVIGGRPVSAGGAGGAAEATADALTKLADLRDRGVLTDEEFQTQKKKLLGEQR